MAVVEIELLPDGGDLGDICISVPGPPAGPLSNATNLVGQIGPIGSFIPNVAMFLKFNLTGRIPANAKVKAAAISVVGLPTSNVSTIRVGVMARDGVWDAAPHGDGWSHVIDNSDINFPTGQYSDTIIPGRLRNDVFAGVVITGTLNPAVGEKIFIGDASFVPQPESINRLILQPDPLKTAIAEVVHLYNDNQIIAFIFDPASVNPVVVSELRVWSHDPAGDPSKGPRLWVQYEISPSVIECKASLMERVAGRSSTRQRVECDASLVERTVSRAFAGGARVECSARLMERNTSRARIYPRSH